MGNEVCILSVLDEAEGGQVIGQANTWRRAVEAFKEWSVARSRKQVDLDVFFKKGLAKIAIYHNGGKGERASPATQSLGNSRAEQDTVGKVINAHGDKIDLKLLHAIVLETAPIAATNDGARVDTIWANQIAWGTKDFSKLHRSNYIFDKMVIALPDEPKKKDLFDYGTAIVSEDGKITKFLSNKVLTKKNKETGQFEDNPEFDEERNELLNAPKGVFDYGSFSMSRDMHYALIDYWTNVRGVFNEIDETGKSSVKRDIDPALVQVIVPFINGIAGKPLPENLPSPEELRSTSWDDKIELLDNAYKAFIAMMDDRPDFKAAVEKIYNDEKKKEFVLETIEIFILYQDELFSDPEKVIGHIDLGENSHWFAYKRLLDMGNEKFLMLADITGNVQVLGPDGVIARTDSELDDVIRAEDARRMRGIQSDSVAKFITEDGRTITLTLDQVKKGWTDEALNIVVKGSIIQGNTVLMAGSKVVNSVVNNSQGQIFAENSYVESTTAPVVDIYNSILLNAIDAKEVKANKEIVADAFRPQIKDDRFPVGQTRMRAPVDYDPKGSVQNDKVKFGDNAYTFQDIREMPCVRPENDAIKNQTRIEIMMDNQMRQGLDALLASLAASGQLTHKLVTDTLASFNNSEAIRTNSKTRTELVYLCNLLITKYSAGDENIAEAAELEKEDLIGGNLYGPTIDPDIYRRDSVRAIADIELTDPVAKASGAAYVLLLADLFGKDVSDVTIAMGRESRVSGGRIMKAFIDGAVSQGAKVIDATNNAETLTSTPGMYFASRYLLSDKGEAIDGIVETTASHLPGESNGLKPTQGAVNFTSNEMQLWLAKTHEMIDKDIYEADVSKNVLKQNVKPEAILSAYHTLLIAALEGSDEWYDYVDQVYAEKITLAEAIEKISPRVEAYVDGKPLSWLELAADSGYGSTGPIIKGLAVALGMKINDIGAEADYSLAVKDANPNNPDNLVAKAGQERLVPTVEEKGANFGIAFDVDGDRLAVVTRQGKILRGDDISAIMVRSAIRKAKARGEKNPVIIANVLCSDRLKAAITEAGGIAIESAVGFNKVKEAMASPYELYLEQYPERAEKPEITRDTTAIMGVEISSHIMFRENFNADDALFAVMKLIGVLRDEEKEYKAKGEEMPEDIIDIMSDNLNTTLGIPTDYHTGEWRTKMISNDARLEVANAMRDHYVTLAAENPNKYRVRNELDGVKVDFLDNGEVVGFLAVRPSGTSPEMVVVANSIVNETYYNMIVKDYLGQMKLYQDKILFDKLEPEAYQKLAKAAAAGEEEPEAATTESRDQVVTFEQKAAPSRTYSYGVTEDEDVEEVEGGEDGEVKIDLMFEETDSAVNTFDRLTVLGTNGLPKIVKGRENTIVLGEGQIKVHYKEKGKEAVVVSLEKSGEAVNIPANLAEPVKIIQETGQEMAKIDVRYELTDSEKALYLVNDAIFKHQGRVAAMGDVTLMLPAEFFPRDERGNLRTGEGSAQWLGSKLGELTGNLDPSTGKSRISIETYSSTDGLRDLASKTKIHEGENGILLATQDIIESINYDDSDVNDLLTGKKGNIRVLTLSNIEDDEEIREQGWYFRAEAAMMGLLLGAINPEEIDSEKDPESIAADLHRVIEQVSGQQIDRNNLYYMLSYGEQSAIKDMPVMFFADPKAWLEELIKKVLVRMPIKPFDARDQLEQRRRILWAA